MASIALPVDPPAPAAADRGRFQLTVSRALLDKLEAARDALASSLPGATSDEVLEAALDLLLELDAKRRERGAREPSRAR